MKKLLTFLTLFLMLGGVARAEDRLYLNCKFAGGESIIKGKLEKIPPGNLPDQNIELDIKNKKIIYANNFTPFEKDFFENWTDTNIIWGIHRMIVDKKTGKLKSNSSSNTANLNRYTGDYSIEFKEPGEWITYNYKCVIKKKIF